MANEMGPSVPRNPKQARLRKFYWSELSTNRKIFGAASIIGFFTIAVKLVSVFKEVAVAGYFGVGKDLDSFVIALSIPFLLNTIISVSLYYALVPTYLKLVGSGEKAEAVLLLRKMIFWSVAMLLFAMTANLLAAQFYLPYMASGFSPENLRLTYKLMILLSPIIIMLGISGTWSAILNTEEKFAISSLVPILTPIAILVSFFLFRAKLGVYSLALGTVLGGVLEMTVLGMAMKNSGIRLIPVFSMPDENMKNVLRAYLPMVGGALLMNGTTIVDNTMSAMLEEGSVSSLAFAGKLIAFPTSFAVMTLGTAVFPYFSKLAASEDWLAIRNTFGKYLKLVFFLSVPITIGLIFFSEPIVKMFYERGAFKPSDTKVVARIFGLYVLQVPFYIGSVLLVRLLSAMHCNKTLMIGAGVNLLANIIFNLILMKFLGVSGIALSTSLVYVVSFFFMWIALNRRMRGKW